MAKITLTYGGGNLGLELPPGIAVDPFAPRPVEHEIDFESFRREFQAHGGDRAIAGSPAIVVNDAYRHTPTAAILSWLDTIDSTLLDRASFLVATGTHETPREDHYRIILGPHYDRLRSRITAHDCRDRASMEVFTVDPLGGLALVNRAVLGNHPVIVIGSVEPHYFAGFTGGRKGLVPGLIDLATIERNHNLAVSLEAAPLRLVGNPVAEHLQALTDRIDSPRFFSIQVVTDEHHRLGGVFCGRLRDSFERAAALADRIYAHHVAPKYDLLLAELLPPLDRNLYQLQKAVENCQKGVADGGSLIVVSACEEGIGSPHFFDLAANWDAGQNRPRDGQLSFGAHKLSRVVAITRRINVLVYSRLFPEDVRRVFYEPLDNVQDFLYSKTHACEKCNLAVVRDAGHTVLTT